MQRHRAHRVIDPQLFDISRNQRHDDASDHRDDEGHRRPVKVQPRRDRDDPAQRTRHHPERVMGHHPGRNRASGKAHQDVEGHRRQRDRRAVDRMEDARAPAPRLTREDHAAHQEPPEARDDKHQPDQRRRHRMPGDGVGGAVRIELADPRAKVDQDPQSKEPRNRMDHARGAEVMVAQCRDQPAIRMPTPGRTQDPDEATQHDGQDRETDNRSDCRT